MVTGINHAGLVVKDLEKATEFYRDAIGLKLLRSFERTGEAISQVLGYENTHLKAVLMGTGEGPTLELIQYVNPPPADRSTEERNVLGAGHLAFTVEDAAEALQDLIKKGAKGLNPPVEVSPGRKVCYFQDPEGNWLELVEQKA